MSLEECIIKLSKKQFELRCEKAMQTIQTFNRDEYINKLRADYLLLLLNEKNHYLRFLDVACALSSPEKTIPLASKPIQNIDYLKPKECVHIRSLSFFIDNLMKCDGQIMQENINNPFFINTLTFSLFPAISAYFHPSLIPEIDQDQLYNDENDDVLDFQLHNYNNVFTYLSQKIEENAKNEQQIILYQTVFDLFMRPLFASPLFINFCINFFQPIFSDIQNIENQKENFVNFSIPDYLTSQFNSYYDIYIHLIPSFIAINLRKSNDPTRTIYESFFKIALQSPESAQFYGLFHYSRPPTEELLIKLRNILSGSHNSDVLNMFTATLLSVGEIVNKQMKEWKENEMSGLLNILTCSCSETMLTNKIDDVNNFDSRIGLALGMKNYYFEEESFVEQNRCLFRYVILSNRDIDLLEFILNNDKPIEYTPSNDAKAGDFSIIYFGFSEDGSDDFEEETEKSSNSQSLSITVIDNPTEISPNLRHLLQNSDPIPTFRKIPEELTLEEFFDKYLVQRGPCSTLAKRKMNARVILSLLSYKKKEKLKIKQILDVLPSTSLEQDQEIRVLTNATNIRKKIDKISNLNLKINENTELINNLVLLNDKSSATYFQNFKFMMNQDYISNPKQFILDIRSNRRNLNKVFFSQPKIVLMKMIDHAKYSKWLINSKIIYSSFFLDFVNSTDYNKKIDNKFNSLLSKLNKDIIEKLIENHFPTQNVKKRSKVKINQFLCQKILKMPQNRKEILLICTEAFADFSVLRKLELFSKAFNELKYYVEENMPESVDALGADELTPLMVSVIFLSNATYIASTIAFLNYFFSNVENESINSQAVIMKNLASSALTDLLDILNANPNLAKFCNDLVNNISDFLKNLYSE